MQVARDPPEGQGHQRKRQQHDQREPPVHAQRHRRNHQHQRHRAVEAGQQRLAGGHLDRVDIVGGQRHQVAGALGLEEAWALQQQPLVEIAAQLDAQPVGRAVQQQPPGHPQAVDRQACAQQQCDLVPQRVAGQALRDQAVDHPADLARQPHPQQRDAGEHHRRRRVGAPMAKHETTDQAGQGHQGMAGHGQFRTEAAGRGREGGVLDFKGLDVAGSARWAKACRATGRVRLGPSAARAHRFRPDDRVWTAYHAVQRRRREPLRQIIHTRRQS